MTFIKFQLTNSCEFNTAFYFFNMVCQRDISTLYDNFNKPKGGSPLRDNNGHPGIKNMRGEYRFS